MRAAGHIGLALVVVLAPTVCCCKLRSAAAVSPARPVAPEPNTCCSQSAKRAKAPVEPEHNPRPVQQSCACCDERPPAAPGEGPPAFPSAEPTGEMVPHTAQLPAVALAPRGTDRGASACGAPGGDTKTECLFARHVLRC